MKNASSFATDYDHNTYINSIFSLTASINFNDSLFMDFMHKNDDHEYHDSTSSIILCQKIY